MQNLFPHEDKVFQINGLRAYLFQTSRTFILLRRWQAGVSPLQFVQRLERPQQRALIALLVAYPASCPYEMLLSFAEERKRASRKRQTLYELMAGLRAKLRGSGLVPSPVTREGYLLAVSSLPPTTPQVKEYWLEDDEAGVSLALPLGILVAWRQAALVHCQQYSLFQLRILAEIFSQYPHYCPYERLYALQEHIAYDDPANVAFLFHQQVLHSRLASVQNAMTVIREKVRDIGLEVQTHQELGYQLAPVPEKKKGAPPHEITSAG